MKKTDIINYKEQTITINRYEFDNELFAIALMTHKQFKELFSGSTKNESLNTFIDQFGVTSIEFLDDQLIKPDFSMFNAPCGLTICRGVVIGTANFKDTTLNKLCLKDVIFKGDANFSRFTITVYSNLKDATFEGEVDFSDSTFKGFYHFDETTFKKLPIFQGSNMQIKSIINGHPTIRRK